MKDIARWTTDDYDGLSWHDVHVHAFRIVEGEHGTAELLLDIDYILEWMKSDDQFSFRIAPATPQFHQVSSLRFNLDYAGPTAAITPFALDGIRREPVTYITGLTSSRWRLDVNWPVGHLEFESPAFTQLLSGAPVVSSRQHLLPGERGHAHGV